MANSSNVTLRQPPQGVDRPLTYEEVDKNFAELINQINDYNTFITNSYTPTVAALDSRITSENVVVDDTGSLVFDVSAEASFAVNIVGTVDITLSNPTANKAQEVWVEASNGGGTISWTTAITWDGGAAPALGATVTVYKLLWINGTWYGKAFASV